MATQPHLRRALQPALSQCGAQVWGCVCPACCQLCRMPFQSSRRTARWTLRHPWTTWNPPGNSLQQLLRTVTGPPQLQEHWLRRPRQLVQMPQRTRQSPSSMPLWALATGWTGAACLPEHSRHPSRVRAVPLVAGAVCLRAHTVPKKLDAVIAETPKVISGWQQCVARSLSVQIKCFAHRWCRHCEPGRQAGRGSPGTRQACWEGGLPKQRQQAAGPAECRAALQGRGCSAAARPGGCSASSEANQGGGQGSGGSCLQGLSGQGPQSERLAPQLLLYSVLMLSLEALQLYLSRRQGGEEVVCIAVSSDKFNAGSSSALQAGSRACLAGTARA